MSETIEFNIDELMNVDHNIKEEQVNAFTKDIKPTIKFSFKTERSCLLDALAHIQSIVERKNTIPILANVKLEINQGKLNITATDMDISVSETIIVDSENNGAITVSAHLLYEIIKKLPANSDVECHNDAENKSLNINSSHCSFSLPILDAEMFPVIDEINFEHNFTLNIHDTLDLFNKTHFAISTEETRYYLNGVYLHSLLEEKKISAVATDGHRLASIKIDAPEAVTNNFGVIVPRKTVYSLMKLLTGLEGEIKISLSSTKIKFNFGSIIMVSKLIDATFPEYKRVIPSGNDITMEALNSAIDSAVDRVSILSNDKVKAVKFTYDENKNLVITSESNESGKAIETLEVSFNSTPPAIAFNAKYILDITSNVSGDKINFKFAKGVAPTIISDEGDDRVLYVLMPIRI